MKLLNKFDKEGHFICNRCENPIGLGIIIKRLIYCPKCYDIIKGKRNEKGMEIREVK